MSAGVSEPFIRRPVATTLLMVGVLLVGLLAFTVLPVSALPQVDYPTIVVSTYLPGGSAETMASAVTTPLERQFGQMPSLTQMTSVSSFDYSEITLQFDLDRNIDAAQQDVQAAINAASSLLPSQLPTPPTYSKSNPADQPILTLAISSDVLPLDQVDDYADSILAQKISQVSGVGLVTINGGQKPAVRVQVDPEALGGTGLTMEDVRAALVAANVNQPKGNIDGPRQDYTLATNDQLYKAEGFKPLVIAYVNGSPVRLRDIARVVDGVENAQLAGWANDKRAIILNVQRQPGANVIQVADRVKALLPQLKASLPQSVDVKVLTDRTETVRASVEDVERTLVITVGLVVAVIFLFLRNIRATIIPSIAVPLSLIGTFGIMYLVGYSLNNLSLMALTIATGFVVDDAIVMIENIARYIEAGDDPFDAALKGAGQIGFTIVSLTVSLVAVLIPLLFMGGLIGRLFREFAVTLAASIGVSAILSLTLTPMMCAHLLRPEPKEEDRSALYRWSERGFEGAIHFYDQGLKLVFRHPLMTLVVTIATVAFTAYLAMVVPKGFFPQQDTGVILAVSEASADTSFPKMMELQESLAAVILKDPDVQSISSSIGSDGTNPTTNSGSMTITLKPRENRDANADAIIARLQPQVAKVEGIQLFMQPVQDLTIDSRVSRTQYQYTLEDADPNELATWAPKLVEELRKERSLRDVASDQETAGLQVSLTIDRDTASRLGISPQVIDDTLYDAFGQRQVSIIFTQLNLYRVILEVKPEMAETAKALQKLFVRTPNGTPVPLSTMVHETTTLSPLAVNHQGQFPAVTISFNLAAGESLGTAVDVIDAAQARIGVPSSVHSDFAGTAQAFNASLASEPVLILAALITVYIVLGILYESYIHPITILSTLPSAGVGAFLALMVCRTDFSVIALIGIILLIGIVKKNAIMMIDFALEAERDQGKTPQEAIHEACLLRFRPIMMTTMAALLGGLPLALGTGTGAELRRPLGITIVGGLLISQVLTLYTTPIVYLYMDRLGHWLKPRARSERLEPTAAPAAQ
ncbi:MAG TPA: multidrug efflux RND transporter permease subunit [Polyangiaceae bacterium]|nr:multidrug efflux RND transporter permease subunit [Polyangiaceae bacterium]